MENAANNQNQETQPPRHLVARLLGLGVLLGLTHYWLARHLDIHLFKIFEEEPLFSVLIPWVFALGEFLGGEKFKGGVLERLRKVVSGLVHPAVLAILGLAFLLFGSVYSSVTVSPEGALLPAQVSLHRQNEAVAEHNTRSLEQSTDVVRFGRWINPFGRTFLVEVPGYQAYSLELYPWVGAQIRIDRDLRLAPSVLVRVPLGPSHQLLSGGKLQLLSTNGSMLGEQLLADNRASALFGRSVTFEARLLAEWEHDLRATGANEGAVSKGYLTWRHPQLTAVKGIDPGMTLRAQFVAASGATQLWVNFQVPSAPLIDVLLPETSH